MGLDKLFELISDNPGWTAVVVILGGLVTVKKLELPVWVWLRAWVNAWLDGLGKLLNASVAQQLSEMREAQETMQKKIEALEAGQQAQKDRADRDEADRHREQILRFATELGNDIYHDKEAFVEVLQHIDKYAAYCLEHPEYPNSRADVAIENIKTTYAHKLAHGFHKIKFVKEAT